MAEKTTEKISESRVALAGEAIGYFKLNLPSKFEDYQSGNGEGIWAVVLTKKEKVMVDDETNTEPFFAYAANDSCYYPELVCGSRIFAEPRGGNRPIAVWENLTGSKEAEKNAEDTLDKIIKHRSNHDS